MEWNDVRDKSATVAGVYDNPMDLKKSWTVMRWRDREQGKLE